jgi:hypothetical protein
VAGEDHAYEFNAMRIAESEIRLKARDTGREWILRT